MLTSSNIWLEMFIENDAGPNCQSRSHRILSIPALLSPDYFIDYLQVMDYREYIEIRADKRFGKPCLKGTRISVYDVLSWLANGMDWSMIKEDFEEITDDMIKACLAYAADRERKVKVAL